MRRPSKLTEKRRPGRKELDLVNSTIQPFWSGDGIGTAYNTIAANGQKMKLSKKDKANRAEVLKRGERYLQRRLLLQILIVTAALYLFFKK